MKLGGVILSEEHNQHSEEGSFKEQIMRSLEASRKKREELGSEAEIISEPEIDETDKPAETQEKNQSTKKTEEPQQSKTTTDFYSKILEKSARDKKEKRKKLIRNEKKNDDKIHLNHEQSSGQKRFYGDIAKKISDKSLKAFKPAAPKKEKKVKPKVVAPPPVVPVKTEKTVTTPVKKVKPPVKKATRTKPVKNELSISEEIDLKRNERRKEDRVVRKIVYILSITILIIAGIAAISGYNYVSAGLKPLDTNDSKLVEVEIPSGSSNRQIGEILEQRDVIRSGMIFNFYTKFENLTNFQSGYYHFSADMSLNQISKELQQGGSAEPLDDATKITIPEGYDVAQIASLVAKKTDFKRKDFIALMNAQDFFDELKATYPDLLTDAGDATDVRYRLEGYLFPATYNVHSDTTLKDLVTQMVDATNTILSAYYTEISDKGMNVQEVMTLASLVEKEGVTESDRKNIAQVFFNRLSANMALQSDISILYALGEHKETVTYKDTEVDSPYNLYTNTGYGPGPFDNPSQQAIEAVLNPTSNDYYYFVADTSTGKVHYAATYAEHLQLVEKYVNNSN